MKISFLFLSLVFFLNYIEISSQSSRENRRSGRNDNSQQTPLRNYVATSSSTAGLNSHLKPSGFVLKKNYKGERIFKLLGKWPTRLNIQPHTTEVMLEDMLVGTIGRDPEAHGTINMYPVILDGTSLPCIIHKSGEPRSIRSIEILDWIKIMQPAAGLALKAIEALQQERQRKLQN
ncbi:uncharacterized protein LOC117177276 [Belonocnema kinseyi]|uniref:uncharacterized protein LOC117177276 n=1 Tax=Belonocnema kinseyi TaxID=2817044 RepID=UPI00143DBA29|nr:uncharacterized protein LOC117177276 [Belonocnema kinseyi]